MSSTSADTWLLTREFFTSATIGAFLQPRSDLLAPVIGKSFDEFQAQIVARQAAVMESIHTEHERLQEEFHARKGHTL